MERRRAVLAVACVLGALAGAGCAGGMKNEHIAPPATVDMDAEELGKFRHEIEEYVELHQELLHRIPNVGPQATPEEITAHKEKMRVAIQKERQGERQGEIFRPDVEAAFRRIFAQELAGPEGPAIVQGARQGNPRSEGVPTARSPNAENKRAVTVAVNATYADDAPMSMVPPTLLLKLPQLPEQVKYRFVGRDLILRDTEANVILDYIKNILPPEAGR
jgi:hypothetical protein